VRHDADALREQIAQSDRLHDARAPRRHRRVAGPGSAHFGQEIGASPEVPVLVQPRARFGDAALEQFVVDGFGLLRANAREQCGGDREEANPALRAQWFSIDRSDRRPGMPESPLIIVASVS
jgi:hypothetical protein